MYRKEVNQRSPIRILEQSIHGGLGKGNLGVVMSRAGVGKTACLIHIGLDDLMRERPVLHVAVDQTTEHVLSWYDAIFEDLVTINGLQEHGKVQAMITEKRVIATFTDHDLSPERLEKTVELFKRHLDFKPAAILVDGYPWDSHSLTENAAMLGAFKAYATLLEAELWMSAQTHSDPVDDEGDSRLPPPCSTFEELIDVAIFLEPHGDDVVVRLLKDHDNENVADMHLRLHPDTLRLVVEGEPRRALRMPNSSYTLLSGAAAGAEAEFGACAQAWGLTELNFTFEGRVPERKRGLVHLNEEELAQGAVSPMYVRAHMHRDYPDNPAFKMTLASIWHQVNSAGEVFAIGVIQADNTVRGGTGWAVELARHWRKPVHVYDQERNSWFVWNDGKWHPSEAPVIQHRRFTGTGTRSLTPEGKAAIQGLFERSFGKRPSWG
jgi:hypothetical protein